ncbi:hypothetical protein QN277_024036 [Acacia crassicarpa]|uniref:Uncharacterized protein n=1 Tax=Acacia crassicarpa TaxID=499986 RepID=A0AAE1K8Y2_9FABA|nr:hypothetical protein QN277_024036 [Acacia crassicarpa]
MMIRMPHDDPQMIRFSAHLVLVLRHLLAEEMEMKDAFRDKIPSVGDLILNIEVAFCQFSNFVLAYRIRVNMINIMFSYGKRSETICSKCD